MDSLEKPHEWVRRAMRDHAGVLEDDLADGKALYEAALNLRNLAAAYPSALRASGLLDSVRVVTFENAFRPFEVDVAAIKECADAELSSWQTEVEFSNVLLADSRAELHRLVAFLADLEARAAAAWKVAKNSRNFFDERALGLYSQPVDVLVRLFRLPRGTVPNAAALADSNATAGWTLVFR
jgi:hypothetical protein